MQKKNWLTIAVLATAVAGAIVAIVAFMKRKGKKINDELDFDDSTYYDDDMEGEIGVPDDDLDEAEEEITKAPEDRIADMNQDDETV